MYFHAMGGREGLIDTAVKTSETGVRVAALISFSYYHTLSTTIAILHTTTTGVRVTALISFSYFPSALVVFLESITVHK
jgi:DNA-directed RNA polymerase beta' subunit